jgi:hypothetical protein
VFRKEILITVRRKDGRVETYRVAVDRNVGGDYGSDLVTTWGFRLMCNLFALVPRGTTLSIDFVDLSGASWRYPYIVTDSLMIIGSGCVERAPYIGFGASSIAPSRSDYKLISELVRVRGSHFVDESAFTCYVSGSWSPTSDVTVCEVGLYMLVCDSGGVARYVLFDRSVLDPCVSVRAGDTISVTYAFRF